MSKLKVKSFVVIEEEKSSKLVDGVIKVHWTVRDVTIFENC